MDNQFPELHKLFLFSFNTWKNWEKDLRTFLIPKNQHMDYWQSDLNAVVKSG